MALQIRFKDILILLEDLYRRGDLQKDFLSAYLTMYIQHFPGVKLKILELCTLDNICKELGLIDFDVLMDYEFYHEDLMKLKQDIANGTFLFKPLLAVNESECEVNSIILSDLDLSDKNNILFCSTNPRDFCVIKAIKSILIDIIQLDGLCFHDAELKSHQS